MPYQFTASEIARLQAARALCPAGDLSPTGSGNWVPFYQELSQIIAHRLQYSHGYGLTQQDLQDLRNAKLWLDVAIGANGSTGMHSTFIRTYTNRQGELRLGESFTEAAMQTASNAVALNLWRDLSGLNGSSTPWVVPFIASIAQADASAIGISLFSGVLSATDTAITANSAWSGALGFSLLGGDSPFESWRLLTSGDTGAPTNASFNTLDDLKNVLFAVDSYIKARSATISLASLSDWQALLAQFNIIVSSGNVLGELQDIAGLTPKVGAVVNQIMMAGDPSSGGVARFLDMIRGAYQGRVVIGETTDALFAANAFEFFDLPVSQIQSLQARLLPADPGGIAKIAKSDVNARAALAALSSVSVQVDSATAARFSLYDPSTGTGEISDMWIDTRSKVQWLFNTYWSRHETDGVLSAVEMLGLPVPQWGDVDIVIEGKVQADTQYLKIDGVDLGIVTTSLRYFGNDANNTRVGTSADDQLFGGLGADALSGSAGNDYLEGDGGNDDLDGGGDSDTLVGGEGSDTLDGGDGNDTLEGGAGFDTYVFTSTWGKDVVVDVDGSGQIQIGGAVITGANAKSIGSDLWRTDDASITYTVIAVDGSRNDLVIRVLGSAAGTITIRDWTANKLGISLGTDLPAIPTTNPLNGDIIKATSGGSYLTTPNGYQSAGTQVNAADVINGTSGNDNIKGFGGSDGIAGGDGDDVIDGGDGDDLLLGGWGADAISGGAGNDHIFGSDLGLIDRPTSTSFTPPASTGVELARGFSWVVYDPPGDGNNLVTGAGDIYPNGETVSNTIDGGAGNDVIASGTGDDTVHGGADNDVIWGMGGSDVMFGDDGDDVIDGDGTDEMTAAYTPDSEHGNDVLIGGLGNDEMWGRGGNDILIGGDDNDKLWGDDPNTLDTPGAIQGGDELFGGNGNDFLWGGGGADFLYGGNGIDHLEGDQSSLSVEYHGNDFLDGGDGDDVLIGGGKDDILQGGAGNDQLQGDSSDLPSSEHGNDICDGGAGNDTLFGFGGVDTLMGGDGDDNLFGDLNSGVDAAYQLGDFLDGGAGNDNLYGNGGNDTLIGGDGDDSLSGGDGNDVLIGGAGSDAFDGGDGDDTYIIGATDAPLTGGLAEGIYDSGGMNVLRIEGVASAGVAVTSGGGSGNLSISWGSGQGVGFSAAINMTVELSDSTFRSTSELIGALSTQSIQWTNGLNSWSYGGSGNDTIASFGNTIISGGRGNDVLSGSGGNNSYLYSRGDGTDQIYESSGGYGGSAPSRLIFGAGITSDSLRLGLGSLKISIGDNPNDVIHVEGFDPSNALTSAPIAYYVFADGTVLTHAELLQRGFDIQGTAASDTLTGTSVTDRIYGGAGNDTLSGGAGSDTYFWGVGSGSDTVNNVDTSSGRVDTIQITGDLLPTDVLLSRSANDLTLYSLTTADSIRVANYFNGAAIDQIAFENGTVWNSADIASHIVVGPTPGNDVITGTSGDDVISGLAGNDTISGLAGNDTITGGAGNDSVSGGVGSDIYLFAPGHGSDTLDENGSAEDVDIIRLTSGIQETGVAVQRDGVDAVLKMGVTDQIRIVGAWDPTATSADRVERIEFASGAVWTEQDLRNRALAALTTSAPDVIFGFDGSDIIHGGPGEDTLYGLGGNDNLYGDENYDVLHGGDGDDVLVGGAWGNALYGGLGNDTFVFGDEGTGNLNQILAETTGEGGTDRILFASGISPGSVTLARDGAPLLRVTYTVSGYTNSIEIPTFFAAGTQPLVDQIEFADGTIWTYENIKTSFLTGTSGTDVLIGTPGSDVLDGQGGDDTMSGDDGNDTVAGGAGNDLIYAGYGDDIIVGGGGDDALNGGPGNDIYRYDIGDGKDRIYESSPSETDIIEFGAGILPSDVQLYRRQSHLAILVGNSDSQMRIQDYFDPSYAGCTIEQIRFSDGTVWYATDIATRLVPAGTQDTMTGTAGNDTFTVDNESDQIVEGLNQGIDTAISNVDYYLPANVENLTLVGPLDLIGGGNSLANVLTGNSSDNYLEGMGGVDTFIGGLGDDTFRISTTDGVPSQIIENPGEGYDTVEVWIPTSSSRTFFLPANVERVNGSNGVNLIGNDLDNVLDGTFLRHATTIDGGLGADVMIGNPSTTQTFYVDDPGDVIVDAGPGFDGVYSLISYTLAEEMGPDKLLLIGSTATSATGNSSNNQLEGNAGNNTLYGLAGSDTLDPGAAGTDSLIGGLGDDIYIVGRASGITVMEAAGEGTDVVRASVTYALGLNVENLELTGSAAINGTGNELDNVITGNEAGNVLTGLGGNDTLSGDFGNDQYREFGATTGNDLIIDVDGTDSLAYSSSENVTVEALQFAKIGDDLEIAISAESSITVQGWYSSSTNVIESLSLFESGLQFTYSAAQIQARADGINSGPTVNATVGAQSATIGQSFFWQAPLNAFSDVETQHSLGYSASLSDGSALPSWLAFDSSTRTFSGIPVGSAGTFSVRMTATDAGSLSAIQTFNIVVAPAPILGTSANDILNGTSGDDVMDGLSGDDTINGLGGNDTIRGSDGNDAIDGGSGNDQMDGGAGNDTYVVDSAGDVVTEAVDEGIDFVQSAVAFTLGNNVENLTLTATTTLNGTGNVLDNLLIGGSGSNTLSGLGGNDTLDPGSGGTDTLKGGAGDDIYILNRSSGVTITEFTGEGTDLVLAAVTHILGSFVENLTLTGTAAVNGTGNTSDNVITGNSANNTLNPGTTGTDTLVGGLGDDTYVLSATRSGTLTITELAGEGTDTVQSGISHTLLANVENLTLTGTAAITGTGNSLDNVLTGNTASNTLTGLDGNDTLNPGTTGTDTLVGGLGDDTYVLSATRSGTLTITELAGEGTDTVQSGISHTLSANVENLTLTGTTAITGTGNSLDNVLRGNTANNTLTGLDGNDTLDPGTTGTDTLVGGLGNDTYVLSATRSGTLTITEAAGAGTDAVQSGITHALSANVELLFLTGSAAINGTGNSLNNLLRGNTAINTLAGGGGTDILEGGDGNDILSNASGNTLYNGGIGADTVTGSSAKELFIGGTGNDSINTGTGADLIVFNKGDGSDTVAASTTRDNVLSIGGGTLYADLLFQKSGDDLILQVGASDQITFTGYYASTSNRSVDKLQMVIEGTSDYLPGGGDNTRDNKIETFNFEGLVTAFDAARTANPSLTTWALTNALAAQYLTGSDTAAIGGDLAYRYNRFGNLGDISYLPAVNILGNANFATSAQTLQSTGSLHDSTPRLS